MASDEPPQSARKTRRSSVAGVDDMLFAGMRGDQISIMNDGRANTYSTDGQGASKPAATTNRRSSISGRRASNESKGSTTIRYAIPSQDAESGSRRASVESKGTAGQEVESDSVKHSIGHQDNTRESVPSETENTMKQFDLDGTGPVDEESNSEVDSSVESSWSKRFGGHVVVDVTRGKAEAARRRGSVTFDQEETNSQGSADSDPQVDPPFVSATQHKVVVAPKRRLQAAVDEDAHLTGEEFLQLDYTPCINTRPMDLSEQLRCVRLGRHIRVMICITAYTEKGEEVKQTLQGLAENMSM